MASPTTRDVLVVSGTLAGTAAALAAVRSGARTRLLVQGASPPPKVPPIPEDPVPLAEEAIERFDAPAPEEPNLFRLRSRRVRRWLGELGIENDEAWAQNLHQAILERIQREGGAVDEISVAVRLIGDAKSVNGAVLVDGSDCTTHRADTTILAGGGARFLWPGASDASPPSGLALALRAKLDVGDAGQIAWREEGGPSADGDRDGNDPVPTRFLDGVRGDGRGHLSTPGVAACGEALACAWHGIEQLSHLEDVVRGLEAGDFQGAPPDRRDPELVPLVDEPMPPGFTKVKLGRLRGVLSRYAGPEATSEQLEEGHAELLSLRGEFADYARARAGTDVQLLHQAADVALAHVASRFEG